VSSTERSHRPRKRFGQHFLHDPGVIGRIVAAIRPVAGDRLVEIGPGLGALTGPSALTGPLLNAVGELDVVELDRDLLEPLRARCAGSAGTLRIHHADALEFDFAALRGDGPRLRVVGNLPYNISTPLLFYLLAQAEHLQDLHFMLQREVVERMVASPGEGSYGRLWSYGRLSVMLQYRCRAESLFAVGPGAFRPPPKVESAVVRLVPRETSPVAVQDERQFAEVVRRAFAQRRKTLRNALRGLLDTVRIEMAGVDPGARPETLSLAAFAALSNSIVHPSESNS